MKRISILTLVLMILLSCTAFAENWKWVTSTDTMSYYMGFDTIHQQRQSFAPPITSMWLKTVYTPESLSALIADCEKNNRPTEGYENLVSSIAKLEFYRENENYFYRIISLTFYNIDGNPINSMYGDQSWENVLPGTVIENICKNSMNILIGKEFRSRR